MQTSTQGAEAISREVQDLHEHMYAHTLMYKSEHLSQHTLIKCTTHVADLCRPDWLWRSSQHLQCMQHSNACATCFLLLAVPAITSGDAT